MQTLNHRIKGRALLQNKVIIRPFGPFMCVDEKGTMIYGLGFLDIQHTTSMYF